MEKYKELFYSSKYVLDEEMKRFSRIDEKASKYLSVLIIFFGLFSFVFKWSLDAFIPILNIFDFIGFLLLISYISFIAIAFYFSFRVLKTHELRVMSLNDKMINFFNENRLIDIYFALSKAFKEAHQENVEKVNRKGIYLSWSYRFIIFSFVTMLLFFPLMGVKIYNKKIDEINIQKKEVLSMTKEEKNNSQDNGSSTDNQDDSAQQKPDTSIQAPEFDIRTEGYEPSKETKKKSQISEKEKSKE